MTRESLAEFENALTWLEGQEDQMIALVKDWSLVNSGSFNMPGLREMGDRVKDAFGDLDVDVALRETEPGEEIAADGSIDEITYGPALHFQSRSRANRRILFTGHLDTVFAADHPFQDLKMLSDDVLNGPGVADMKGGLIVMLWALKAIERSPFKDRISYEILVSSDEEVGSIGSAPLLAECAKRADFGMTFEPALADGTLAGARKGSGNFTLVVRGRAAHAGRDFYDGRNAILALSGFVERLYKLNGQCGEATFNPAIIEGGSATNIVPDLAILRFNIRVKNSDEQTDAEAAIKELVDELNSTDGINASLHGGINRPPKELSEANIRLFEALKGCGDDLGIEVDWKPTGGCCEGNNLAAAGLPNIDSLGVRGGKIHSSEEFVCLDSFVERAKLSALLIARHAAGEVKLGSPSQKEIAE